MPASEIIERGAIRLFWRAEQLDPSSDGDVPESEWFTGHFPVSLSARRRHFWRCLMVEAIRSLREPTAEMIEAADAGTGGDLGRGVAEEVWRLMIDTAAIGPER